MHCLVLFVQSSSPGIRTAPERRDPAAFRLSFGYCEWDKKHQAQDVKTNLQRTAVLNKTFNFLIFLRQKYAWVFWLDSFKSVKFSESGWRSKWQIRRSPLRSLGSHIMLQYNGMTYLCTFLDWWIFAILVSRSSKSRWSILGSWKTQTCHTFLAVPPGSWFEQNPKRFRRRWIKGFWKKFIEIFWVLLCKPESNSHRRWCESESATSKYETLRVDRAERLVAASALTSLRRKMRLEPAFFGTVISLTWAWRWNRIWKDQEEKPWKCLTSKRERCVSEALGGALARLTLAILCNHHAMSMSSIFCEATSRQQAIEGRAKCWPSYRSYRFDMKLPSCWLRLGFFAKLSTLFAKEFYIVLQFFAPFSVETTLQCQLPRWKRS